MPGLFKCDIFKPSGEREEILKHLINHVPGETPTQKQEKAKSIVDRAVVIGSLALGALLVYVSHIYGGCLLMNLFSKVVSLIPPISAAVVYGTIIGIVLKLLDASYKTISLITLNAYVGRNIEPLHAHAE